MTREMIAYSAHRAAEYERVYASPRWQEDVEPVRGRFAPRFHARPGNEGAVAEALLDVVAPTREEPGRLSIHAWSR